MVAVSKRTVPECNRRRAFLSATVEKQIGRREAESKTKGEWAFNWLSQKQGKRPKSSRIQKASVVVSAQQGLAADRIRFPLPQKRLSGVGCGS
jgi:hypothetical protein